MSEAEFERAHVRGNEGEGAVLIVGSRVYEGRENRARTVWPHRATQGVDMVPGEGVDVVADLTRADAWNYVLPQDEVGHIECLSVLEHCTKPWALASNLAVYAQPGTTLHLAVPFVWRVHAYPDDYWRFTPASIPLMFPTFEWHTIAIVTANAVQVWKPGDKVAVPTIVRANGVPHFERAMVCAFGVQR